MTELKLRVPTTIARHLMRLGWTSDRPWLIGERFSWLAAVLLGWWSYWFRAKDQTQPIFDDSLPLVPLQDTKLWSLVGSIEITDPEPQFIVGYTPEGKPITNYSENVDEVIYTGR